MQFVRVKKEQNTFFGGNQSWFRRTKDQEYGCGIIACANAIVCLNHKDCGAPLELVYEDYMELADKLARRYFWVMPKLGLNGFTIAIGINLYFMLHKMPYFARWGTFSWNLWKRVAQMLEQKIPVLLAIGPGILPWRKSRLPLYVKRNGTLVQAATTRAHYVMITGMDEEFITISSWGKRFLIRKTEYEEYVRKHSNYLFSNILVINNL